VRVWVLCLTALRWVPPPTSAFMLQSREAVRYSWVPMSRIAPAARAGDVASGSEISQHHGFDVEAMQKAYEHTSRRAITVGALRPSASKTAKICFSGRWRYLRRRSSRFDGVIELLWGKDRILEVYLNHRRLRSGNLWSRGRVHRVFLKPAAS